MDERPTAPRQTPRLAAPPSADPIAGAEHRLVVGKKVRFGTEIAGCELINIAGEVEANFTGRHLNVAKTGIFRGTASVETAEIYGHAEGEIVVSGALVLRSGAHLGGTVTYGSIEIEPGATIEGTVAKS